MTSDEIVTTGQQKLASFGANAGAIPWAQIFAMLLQLLSGCIKPPTPASIKSDIDRPLIKITILRRLHSQGIFGRQATEVLQSIRSSAATATDEELTAMIDAAAESA